MIPKRMLVGPEIEDVGTLNSMLGRVAHYFADIAMDEIVVAVGSRLTVEQAKQVLARPTLPPGFSPQVLQRLRQIGQSVRFVPQRQVPRAAMTAAILLVWDRTALDRAPWSGLAKGYRLNRTVFDVDWRATRTDGTWFAEAAHLLANPTRRFDSTNGRLFQSLTSGLECSDTAYLIATGPSARAALDVDMTNGVRIVCNTVILDDEIMDHACPDIVTFADPIFHFGPSTYAQRFQTALRRQATRFDFAIVIPERYTGQLSARMPEIKERIVGVRIGTPSWAQNLNLLRNLAVRPYPNILTMMMLPLAATFARDIHLIGFDGRAPESQYFWQHGSTVQLEKELEEIRLVHPGFFELDYEDYYQEHLGRLEHLLTRIEQRGGSAQPRSPTLMAPLRRRARLDGLDPLRGDVGDISTLRSAALVSVTPDWVDDWGHFGPMERALRSAASRQGREYRSLTGTALVPSHETEWPTFTHNSHREGPFHTDVFEAELRQRLDQMLPSSHRIHVFFYTTDVWHLPAILAIATDYDEVLFSVNLMRSHPLIRAGRVPGDAWTDSVVDLLRGCIEAAHGTTVAICVDTPVAANDVRLITGSSIRVWPMVMMVDPDRIWRASDSREKGPIRVVSPVNPSVERGFGDVVGLAERLRGRVRSGRVSLVARFVRQVHGTPAWVFAQADRFVELGGELIEGNLNDERYAASVRDADVVLLPYRRRSFRTRTSGVFVDAIAAGKPVVAVRGTWAGDFVERYGVGMTYEEGNLDELHEAVELLLARIDEFTERVRQRRKEFVEMFSPAQLIDFLVADGDARPCRPPSRDDVAPLVLSAALLVDAYWGRQEEFDSEKISHLVAADDILRQRDERADESERLRREVQRRQQSINSLKRTVEWASYRELLPPSLTANVYRREARAHLDELRLLARLIRPRSVADGVMIDVGASHGTAFKRFRDADWRILAFEPDPRHADYLAEHFGGDRKISLDRRAVTDVSGAMTPFYISNESHGVSGLTTFLESHERCGEVETIALRDIPGLDRVDLLKIATVGCERQVLQGFPWDRVQPDVVMVEFEDRKTAPLGSTYHDLAGLLTTFGYQVWVSEWHPVIRHGMRHDWHRLAQYPISLDAPDAWGNLLALKEPRTARRMARALVRVLDVEEPSHREMRTPPDRSPAPRPRLPRARRSATRTLRAVGIEPSRVKQLLSGR